MKIRNSLSILALVALGMYQGGNAFAITLINKTGFNFEQIGYSPCSTIGLKLPQGGQVTIPCKTFGPMVLTTDANAIFTGNKFILNNYTYTDAKNFKILAPVMPGMPPRVLNDWQDGQAYNITLSSYEPSNDSNFLASTLATSAPNLNVPIGPLVTIASKKTIQSAMYGPINSAAPAAYSIIKNPATGTNNQCNSWTSVLNDPNLKAGNSLSGFADPLYGIHKSLVIVYSNGSQNIVTDSQKIPATPTTPTGLTITSAKYGCGAIDVTSIANAKNNSGKAAGSSLFGGDPAWGFNKQTVITYSDGSTLNVAEGAALPNQ